MHRTLFDRLRTYFRPPYLYRTAAGAVVVVAVVFALALFADALGRGGERSIGGVSASSGGGWPGMAPAPMPPSMEPDYAQSPGFGMSEYDMKAAEEAGFARPGMAVGQDGAGGDLPSLDAGRSIVRTGTMDLQVESVSDAFDRVRLVATAHGGYVADSSFSGGSERQSAVLTLRVPVNRFGDVVAELRGLAVEVDSISSSSRDVTGEYTDIEATLRNLRAVETQYATLLGRADTIGDVLQVQDRLNQVRLQIDRTEARRQALESLTEMSTLTVALRPVSTMIGSSSTGLLGAAADAWAASLHTLERIATAAVVVVVYSWWLVPPVVVAVLILRRFWRRDEPGTPPAAV